MRNTALQIILPAHAKTLPSTRELSAARIIAAYFKANVYIIPTSNRKTADFRINGIMWELKTPTGSGKYNIQHALRAALTQSSHIIIDARFSKKHINRIKAELNYQFRQSKNIKELLLIDKYKNVVALKRGS